MLVSTRIRTRVLPERKKSENFLSKALPLSHWGLLLNNTEFKGNLFKPIYLVSKYESKTNLVKKSPFKVKKSIFLPIRSRNLAFNDQSGDNL